MAGKKIKPVYSKSIVCFIDILGFKKIIDNSGENASSVYSIVNEFKNLSKPSRGLRSVSEDYNFEESTSMFTHFSDSIIRSFAIKNPNDINSIIQCAFDEVKSLGFLQAELLKEGDTFIRGALVYGDIFHNKDFVFGEALNNAYTIESEFSIYPRIIIDNTILNFIDVFSIKSANASDAYFENEVIHELKECILRSEDGFYFINYLYCFLVNDHLNEIFDVLQWHKTLILRNIKNTDKKDILVKYNWLGLYHNQFVNNLPHKLSRGRDLTPFRIMKKDLKSIFIFGPVESEY